MKWKFILLAGYCLGLFSSEATAQWFTSGSDIYYNSRKVGELQMKLLQKIEEMTLHMIEQQKRIDTLEKKLEM